MPSFTLGGVAYEYLTPASPDPERVQSWEYRHWPRVEAAVPLMDGGTVTVYAEASRWSAESVHVRWQDDEDHFHQAWVPKAAVRRMTPSEWDIIEFQRTPDDLRRIRWGKRLPGFLPTE